MHYIVKWNCRKDS